ncbi:MAG TPA: hypothetical protein VK661_06765 [Planctomycetota bacterium]|jgi:hypothetical protein|nr:hypothetical protein [Planctomycetota bacterium]
MEVVSVGASLPDRRLKLQWVIIGVALPLYTVVLFLAMRVRDPGASQAFAIPGWIVSAIAHASWITLDCQRHGRPVGWWRFGAILLGPFAIWLYLVVAYGRRALYLIPLSMLVYVVAPFLMALGLTVIFHR